MSRQSEGVFKQKVVRELKEIFGHDIDILTTQERARVGVADLIICLSGKSIRIELKVEGKSPTKLQQHKLDLHSRAGGLSFWSTPSKWPEQLQILKNTYARKAS